MPTVAASRDLAKSLFIDSHVIAKNRAHCTQIRSNSSRCHEYLYSREMLKYCMHIRILQDQVTQLVEEESDD